MPQLMNMEAEAKMPANTRMTAMAMVLPRLTFGDLIVQGLGFRGLGF